MSEKEERKEGNPESALEFGKIRENIIRARVARLGVLQLNGPRDLLKIKPGIVN